MKNKSRDINALSIINIAFIFRFHSVFMNVKAQNMNVIGIMPIISFDHLAFTISSGLMQPDHRNISYLDIFVFLILILI